MAAPPAREVVLRAVVLPSIEAQVEAPRAEPPPPERKPETRARVSRPTHRDAGAAWSEDDAQAAFAAPSQPSPPTLADARASPRSLVDAREPVDPALTEATAQAVGRAPQRLAQAPALSHQSGASLSLAQAAGASLAASGAASARAVQAARAAPALAAASVAAPRQGVAGDQASIAEPGATSAAMAPASVVAMADDAKLAAARSASTPPGNTASSAPASVMPVASAPSPVAPDEVAPGPLAHARVAVGGAPATLARAASPDINQGDVRAAGVALAAGDTAPGHARLAGVERNDVPLAAARPGAGGGVSVSAATAERAAPAVPAPVLLARVAPGRPLPVSGGGEGAFDSVDYADDNPGFVYPRLAIRLGLQGTVLLEVEVLPDGRPGTIRLKQSSGHEQLDRDALRQMATWRFKPQIQRGRAQTTRVTVPVHYRLDAKGRP